MNIIEKALEKLEEEIEHELPKRDVPAERREADAVQSAQAAPAPAPERESPTLQSSTLESPVVEPPPAGAAPGPEAADESAAEPMPPALDEAAAPGSEDVAVVPPDAGPGVAAGDEQTRSPGSRQVELDLERLSRTGFITPGDSRSLIAEEHRLIKRPLLRRATIGDPLHVKGGNLISIMSALPHEGKTFIAINLAMSIAMEMDRNVLLVDADVANSDVSQILGVSSKQGLSSYLAGEETDLSKLLLRTNVDSLTLLPSGPNFSHMTEMLASEQMRSLVDELSMRYPDRIVVFDSPPLLATSGASVLASLVGQVVMVVEAVRTSQSAVREALRHLNGVENVSIVLNKQRQAFMPGYSYGYGYGKGYGYAYGNRPVED